ncbi:uncharacterized protein LOC131203912 [Ahaetulla prasina]|uniref:uncharacterized protein LOC131203912 n=1 Tax=Ahaetulla prasina TaxID=499056 RepID=UPI002648BE21|nr:uncharacterized protein LOC131203912 [Ahaetulla prasina]
MHGLTIHGTVKPCGHCATTILPQRSRGKQPTDQRRGSEDNLAGATCFPTRHLRIELIRCDIKDLGWRLQNKSGWWSFSCQEQSEKISAGGLQQLEIPLLSLKHNKPCCAIPIFEGLPQRRGVQIILQSTKEGTTRINGWKLIKGRSNLELRRNFLTVKRIDQWNSLPPEVYVPTERDSSGCRQPNSVDWRPPGGGPSLWGLQPCGTNFPSDFDNYLTLGPFAANLKLIYFVWLD